MATTAAAPEPASKKLKTEGFIPNPFAFVKEAVAYPASEKFLRLLIISKAEYVRPPDNKIFVAQRTDKVIDVWKGLVEHKFLSVPVLQKTKNKYYGFVDMYDIVRFVVEFFGETDQLKNSEDWLKMASASAEFKEKTVNDIMKYPLTRRNPFHPINNGYSLFAAVEALAREKGLHRVPIIDQDRRLFTVITQSQLIKILGLNLDIVGDVKNKPVMATDRYLQDVYTVHEDSIAMDAFRLMAEKEVGGLAVIDSDGKLTGVISVRDLKAISTDARMFWRLYQTVKNFLLKIRKENNETGGDRPRSVVTVKPADTLETVIHRLAEHDIHRIFVVDDHKKPIGVISLKDVLYEIIKA